MNGLLTLGNTVGSGVGFKEAEKILTLLMACGHVESL